MTTAPKRKLQNKLFALLEAVLEQSDFYTNIAPSLAKKELLQRIKLATMHYDLVDMEIGDIVVRVRETKTISLDSMSDKELSDLYNTAYIAITADKELNVPELVLEGF